MSFKLIKLTPVTFHLTFYDLLSISMMYDRSRAWMCTAHQPTFEKTPFFALLKRVKPQMFSVTMVMQPTTFSTYRICSIAAEQNSIYRAIHTTRPQLLPYLSESTCTWAHSLYLFNQPSDVVPIMLSMAQCREKFEDIFNWIRGLT